MKRGGGEALSRDKAEAVCRCGCDATIPARKEEVPPFPLRNGGDHTTVGRQQMAFW